MKDEINIDKVKHQHAQMEDFFTGFTLRSKPKKTNVTPLNTNNKGTKTKSPTLTNRDIKKVEQQLEQIAQQVSACRKCPLGSSRTNPVPGEGYANARIMFIGEAPGADEDAQGRPFVGRAGQLLDKIINACGLQRSEVFIGNILKCRPPDNRDPRPDEIVSCLPYLQQQIELINPEVIVALGAHAARTLLDTNKPIGQLRGHFHDYCSGIGKPIIKLMATYHTAYILRNYTPDTRRKVWEDMKKVLAELDMPVPDR